MQNIITDYKIVQHITTYSRTIQLHITKHYKILHILQNNYKIFDLCSRSQADAHLWVFLAIRPCEKGCNNIWIRPQDANFGILNYIHDYGSLF